MATFFPSRSFFENGGKIYFLRGRTGPTYVVTPNEKARIIRATRNLHLKMAAVIAGAFGGFGIFVVFLPEILDLPFNVAMVIMVVLTLGSLVPLGLTLRFHLTLQNQIRGILGTKNAVEFDFRKDTGRMPEKAKNEPEKTESPPPKKRLTLMDIVRKRERKARFFWVFFLGVVITSVGVTMLFGVEELTTKQFFIWVVWLMTGLGLLLVGMLGIIYRLKDRRTGEKDLRK